METTENYIKDGMTHLSDAKYYSRLVEDINPALGQNILDFLNKAHQRGLIDSDTFQFLKPSSNSRTPLIYFLKKLHKNPISVRPIVSHVKSPTTNLSAFIDNLLNPIVKQIDHTLITELQALNYQPGNILVSLDVKSLYPNILIDESIQVILNFIETQNDPNLYFETITHFCTQI